MTTAGVELMEQIKRSYSAHPRLVPMLSEVMRDTDERLTSGEVVDPGYWVHNGDGFAGFCFREGDLADSVMKIAQLGPVAMAYRTPFADLVEIQVFDQDALVTVTMRPTAEAGIWDWLWVLELEIPALVRQARLFLRPG